MHLRNLSATQRNRHHSPSIHTDKDEPMGFRDKAKAVAAIPEQVKTMTVMVIAAVILSIIALMTSLVAVRHAN